MLTVYRQGDPIPTGDTFTRRDEYGEPIGRAEFCRANLVKVGEARTFAEAKKLCVAPIVAPAAAEILRRIGSVR